tara:strand:+ start:3174 stop:3692 length:519 start_codon:yes stop_codon:yes gene_type:complete
MKQQVKIYKIKGNPHNPRIIKNDKFRKLVKSIQEFPEMLEKRPIVVDENLMVLGGNMRLKASKDAGLKEVWIDIAEGWTQEQKDEFVVKDNVNFGEWEWDILANEWDSVQLEEWGLDVWKNEDDEINNEVNDISNNISEEYRVEIELNSETEQEQVYNELIKKGYKCRILTF